MNRIQLKLSGATTLSPMVQIDGEAVNLKRNKFGALEGTYETERDNVELSVCNYHEINARFWWVAALFFFVISLFGILNPGYNRKCMTLDCKFLLSLQGDTVVNLANAWGKEGRALEVTTDCPFEEISNECFVDTRAKKRLRLFLFIKIALWVALIVGLVFLIKSIIVGG